MEKLDAFLHPIGLMHNLVFSDMEGTFHLAHGIQDVRGGRRVIEQMAAFLCFRI